MGRPRQTPAITKLIRADGTEGFRVRWVVRGEDRRRIVATLDEARLLATQWMNSRKEDLNVLPTRLKAAELAEAEAGSLLLKPLGLSLLEAVQWVLANYKVPSEKKWAVALTEYEADRRNVGITEAQISNVVKAGRRFAAFLGREAIGAPSRAEVEGFLSTLGATTKASAYNGLLGDVGTFLAWLLAKGFVPQNPAQGMERRIIKRGLPVVLQPAAVEALLRDLELRDAQWVPYAALCAFGALRPGIRDGEANRLDAALRAGQQVFFPGGIEVSGKAHGTRMLPWKLCGPLQHWLAAYPATSGLWPAETPTIAERQWCKIRERHKFPVADVLRHTGISAMCYAPNASLAEVAIGAGTSEAKIRSNYLGRWSAEMTTDLWGILPSVVPAATQKCA